MKLQHPMVLAHIMQDLHYNFIQSVPYRKDQIATFSTRYYKIVDTATMVVYDIALDKLEDKKCYEETDEYVENDIIIDLIDKLKLLSKKS